MNELDHQEIGRIRFVAEKWGPNKIVVHGGNSLSWVDVSKLHEG